MLPSASCISVWMRDKLVFCCFLFIYFSFKIYFLLSVVNVFVLLNAFYGWNQKGWGGVVAVAVKGKTCVGVYDCMRVCVCGIHKVPVQKVCFYVSWAMCIPPRCVLGTLNSTATRHRSTKGPKFLQRAFSTTQEPLVLEVLDLRHSTGWVINPDDALICTDVLTRAKNTSCSKHCWQLYLRKKSGRGYKARKYFQDGWPNVF